MALRVDFDVINKGHSIIFTLFLWVWYPLIEVLLSKPGLNLLISQIQPWQRLLLSLELLS